MQRLYLVPTEFYDPGTGVVYYGPKYFHFQFPAYSSTGTLSFLGKHHYSFINCYVVLADLTTGEHDALVLNIDVFVYPVNVDENISPPDIAPLQALFEGFNIPTNWLTASNTYRELIQQVWGIMLFAGRYALLAGELGYPQGTFLFSEVALDTQYSAFPITTKTTFDATLVDHGFDPGIILPNMTMRQMLKTASDQIKSPMPIGGVTF